MKKIEKWQIKAIYAIGQELDLVESGTHDDNLHLLVESLTKKNSIKILTLDEANRVISDLKFKMRFGERSASENAPTVLKMSAKQWGKIKALMNHLKSYDTEASAITLDERLRGIIQKVLGREITSKNPLYGLSSPEASKVIEEIKRYCNSAKRHRVSGGAAYESTG